MDAPKPTPRDHENALLRQEIAARQAAEYAEAEWLAREALGPGWTPWMKLTLIDSDHRRTGDATASATVYKVYRGKARLTKNSLYLRRMPDGQVRQADSYEPLVAELLHEPRPTLTIEVRGRHVPASRYELCWSALERYEPCSAEQLARRRATRQRRRQERQDRQWAEENPLLAWTARASQQDRPEEEGRRR
jgi:hypothetical protein